MQLIAATKRAREALAAAVERHGLDQLQIYPVPEPPRSARHASGALFLGLAMLATRQPPKSDAPYRRRRSIRRRKPRPAARRSSGCCLDRGRHRPARRQSRRGWRANTGAPSGAPRRLEKVLLPEVEDAIKRVDEQLDTMEREEAIRTRWSSETEAGKSSGT